MRNKPYLVVKADKKDLCQKDVRLELFKEYKSLQAALKCAHKRNEMFTTSVFGYFYFVFDTTTGTPMESIKRIKAA